MIEVMLQKELHRNDTMINKYLEELRMLPKGSIVRKNRGEKTYFYLNYRTGNKVKSKYIGASSDLVECIIEKIERRKQIEAILKKLYEEKEIIMKMGELL